MEEDDIYNLKADNRFETLENPPPYVIRLNGSWPSYAYNVSDYAYPSIVLPLGIISLLALLANLGLAFYIWLHKLYHNFISSIFIAHLCLTNIIGLGLLMPMFMLNLWMGTNFWQDNDVVCRLQVNKRCTTNFFNLPFFEGIPNVFRMGRHPFHDSLHCRSPSANICANPLQSTLLSSAIAFVLALLDCRNGHIIPVHHK